MKVDDTKIQSLIVLIHEFQNMVSQVMTLFNDAGIDNPAKWQEEGLDQLGDLGKPKEYDYMFHGNGCDFIFKKIGKSVDFDFGFGGRYDGFDAWRLFKFAESGASSFPEFTDQDYLEEVFKEAVRKGIIEQSLGHKEDYLYYLTKNE